MRRVLYIIICIFAIISLISSGFAAFTYSTQVYSYNNALLVVTNWTFENETPFTQETVIEIDNNGNITIDGEEVEGEISTSGDNDTYSNGDVTIEVGVDDEGNVVLTEFKTSNTNSFYAIFGSSVYLPTAITIDGVDYPITGISEPLSISLNSTWFGTNTIYIPDTYTYICAGAFASVTNKATFVMPASIVNIGDGAFMPGSRVTQTINYAGTQTQWNAIEKTSKYENGSGSVSVNYNS